MRTFFAQMTDELLSCLELARGEMPLGPFVEKILRRDKSIKKAAEELGIEFPDRPQRGKYKRSGSDE